MNDKTKYSEWSGLLEKTENIDEAMYQIRNLITEERMTIFDALFLDLLEEFEKKGISDFDDIGVIELHLESLYRRVLEMKAIIAKRYYSVT